MSSEIHEIYFPASTPCPERVRHWTRLGVRAFSRQNGKYISTVKYTIPPPFAPKKELNIGFLSDLHYTGSEKCRKIMEEIERSLQQNFCDILLLGGDMCADSSSLHLLPDVLKRLAKYSKKCFAIPGNWEKGKCWLADDYWKNLYLDCGIEYLVNSKYDLGSVTVTGVDDCGEGYPQIPSEFDYNKFNILLAHRPDTVVWLDRKKSLQNCGLALCGHTHAGQIRIVRGLLPASKYGWSFDYGFFRHKTHDTAMYVSSGAGELSFPLRINSDRELVFFKHSEDR